MRNKVTGGVRALRSYSVGIVLITSIFGVFGLIVPAFSETTIKCEQYQEVFGFQIPVYATQLQDGALLNIKVTYRLTPEAIAKNYYPDFIPIRKDIEKFLSSYKNKGDFWEIINKNLVEFLLEKYPQMGSLVISINVSPTPKEPMPRFSQVSSTRPASCPLISY